MPPAPSMTKLWPKSSNATPHGLPGPMKSSSRPSSFRLSGRSRNTPAWNSVDTPNGVSTRDSIPSP